MPPLDSLPSFSGGNFPQWLRSLKLHLRVGNDQGPEGTVISPPPALMVQIMEAKTIGDASVTWNSEPLQDILAKEENITDDDLDAVVEAFSGHAAAPVSEHVSTLEEQQQGKPAIQLKNLSQGKDMSHQEYYKQATTIMDLLGLEDTYYEDNISEAAEPLSLIQKAVVSCYVQGIEDEQIRFNAYFGGAETLGDAYELVREAAKNIEETRRKEMDEQEEMLKMLTGMSSADAKNVLASQAARRSNAAHRSSNQCNPQ
jgi:hypothetical protein